ncbi:hypothetical protein N9Y00_08280 [Tateyamaria sp.]|nr:hypothetical protein [Tateyamaria sp.]
MSNTESFIEEVTEEVRRDRLYGYLRRYGWIAALLIVLIVAGAGFNEYRRAQAEAKAQALGDAMLAALAENDDAERATALGAIEAESPEGKAILAFLTAGIQAEAGNGEQAADIIASVANTADLPLIYRQVASFKSLIVQSDTLDVETRRAGFEALAVPGVSLRVFAEEQLALLDIQANNSNAAIERFRMIIEDAESTPGLQRRALQAIVALGGSAALDNMAETPTE